MVKKRVTALVASTDPKAKRWRSLAAAARMAYETGEFRQAESLLARALELARTLSEKSVAVPTTEVGMAAVWLAEDRLREAAGQLQKTIAALEAESDLAHKELLAVALRFYANLLSDEGDEREAEKALLRSVKLLEGIGAEASVQLAYTLSDLAGLLVVQERISEAEKYISIAMDILHSLDDIDSAELARVTMIYKLCEPQAQEDLLDQASAGIMQMQYQYGAKHPNMSRALKNYLRVLRQRGDTDRIERAEKRFSNLVSKKQTAGL